MQKKTRRQLAKNSAGSFRIIGGQWRSRRLNFPVVDGLRPTTDRVRETLFNWLYGRIDGASVLDLFAGSGSLGFESLSRGAASATFVEQELPVVQAIRDNLILLGGKAEVVNRDALSWLKGRNLNHVDLIFLDPPFRQCLLDKCFECFETGTKLQSGTLIYLELEKERPDLPVPVSWELQKEKTAGQVSYRLYRYEGAQ